MKKLTSLLLTLTMLVLAVPAMGELVATEDVTVYTRPDHWMTSLDSFGNVYYDLYYAGETSVESQKLHLILPEGEGPFPLLIYVHGGGWSGLNSNEHQVAYTSEASLYAVNCGYAVACVDYRLLGEEGVDLKDMMLDIKAAIRYLRANAETYNIDPEKFALLGESAGGQLVNIVGTTNGEAYYDDFSMGNEGVSSDVQAVVSWYSVAQMSEGLVGWLYAVDTSTLSAEELQAKIDESSAMAHIDANDPPFLLQVGLIDAEVPYTQSLDFYNNLMMAGVDVTIDIFPGYGHAVTGFTCDENAARIVEWLNDVFGVE